MPQHDIVMERLMQKVHPIIGSLHEPMVQLNMEEN